METILNAPFGTIRVRWLAPNAVRVTHNPAADRPWLKDILAPAPDMAGEPEFRVQLNKNGLLAAMDGDTVIFAESAPPVFGRKQTTRSLFVQVPSLDVRLKTHPTREGIRLRFARLPEESYFGFGEWFNEFQRTSGRIEFSIRDAISLTQNKHTYSAIPYYFSSRGYGLILLNGYQTQWQIDPEALVVEANGPGADYILINGPGFKRIIQTYTRLTGRPPLLPRWAFGLWVTSYPQDHQNVVVEHAKKHRERNIPLDAVILDYHWEEKFHNFKWRKSLIPNPEKLIADLSTLGIKLGLILTPFINNQNRPFQKWFLNTLASNLPPNEKYVDERPLEEYAEGLEKGYYAHPFAKWWFGRGGMIDFTNPAAAMWFTSLMKPLYEQGVQFFKNDDGEYLPEEGSHASIGMDGYEFHNMYGFYYGKRLYEGYTTPPQVEGEGRPMIYARSTWLGSQRYPAVFLGDQKPTFESLKRTLRAGLNMSLLGFSYWTGDIFGLDGKTTPETHIRYAQWTLLNPIARYFWRPPAVDNTRFPWSWGHEAEANFCKYTELRYRLLPYYTALGYEAWQTGLPIIRPMVLEFQEATALAGTFDQVMLGPSLMLCPVIEEGATSREVSLPRGTWHDFWSSEVRENLDDAPKTVRVDAPLTQMPIFVRGGSILPMGKTMPFIPSGHQFDEVELHFYPPYPAEFTLFDDDGLTMKYQQNEYTSTMISSSREHNILAIRIKKAMGRFGGMAKARKWTLVLHQSQAPISVSLDGETVNNSFANGCVTINFSGSVERETVVKVSYE